MGTVDKLCFVTGVVHAELLEVIKKKQETSPKIVDFGNLEEWLLEIMARLFDIGSHIAKPRTLTVPESDDSDDDNVLLFEANGIGGGFAMEHVTMD
jgi:hypothetical protein